MNIVVQSNLCSVNVFDKLYTGTPSGSAVGTDTVTAPAAASGTGAGARAPAAASGTGAGGGAPTISYNNVDLSNVVKTEARRRMWYTGFISNKRQHQKQLHGKASWPIC
jgi:hypothetical protein